MKTASASPADTPVGVSYVRWFDTLTNADVPIAGGKNASLGEMTRALAGEGIAVPEGFAITADAYRAFLRHNGFKERIREKLEQRARGELPPGESARAIRHMLLDGELPPGLEAEVSKAYSGLSLRHHSAATDVAVRSSATAEDLPDASFAGQHESYLGVSGTTEVMDACRRCFASVFTERAISYREQKGFDHMAIAVSVGVQKMVRADIGHGAAGVMFSLDTETGFPDVVVINASYGLGECVVQGTVTPDEYRVFKPLLSDASTRPIIEKVLGSKKIKMIYGSHRGDPPKTVHVSADQRACFALDDDRILTLARWAARIEAHYGRPMDMEWAVDGETGGMFMLQARPETVQSNVASRSLHSIRLLPTSVPPTRLVKGLAIGNTIARGKVCQLTEPDDAALFHPGDVLVAPSTNPDWVPLMKKAAAIVTDHGGRSSHAAIVSRELGVPAVVGTANATYVLRNGDEVTVDCAEGETGVVLAGLLEFEETEVDLSSLPVPRTPLMLNIATPEAAFRWWRLPCHGIGLARMEFIIGTLIRIHPMALVRFDELPDDEDRHEIDRLTRGYADKREFFVEHLARGLAHIAASRHPLPVIVRTSDFKTNEYANLLGGKGFEPPEENPMLGFRGASRYYHPSYREGFALECQAIRKAREEIGMDNIIVMIPFCRTPEEADRVLAEMATHGLKRGEDGLQVYVMAEIPSNIILASEFADRFDGFSIGSNDLTQLILGVDRDSEILAPLFDERNEAVKAAIRELIAVAHARHRKVGICGQGPSDHPDFAEFLVDLGIDSISLNPDSLIEVAKRIAAIESR